MARRVAATSQRPELTFTVRVEAVSWTRGSVCWGEGARFAETVALRLRTTSLRVCTEKGRGFTVCKRVDNDEMRVEVRACTCERVSVLEEGWEVGKGG